MKQKMLFMFGIMFSLILILSSGISAQQYCDPDYCPSDYNDAGVSCNLDGTEYECIRLCEKQIEGQCDDNWGGWFSISKDSDKIDISGDQGSVTVYGPPEDSGKCYKYTSSASYNIDDYRIGTFSDFCSTTESVYISSEHEKDSDSGCFESSSGTQNTNWIEYGRGDAFHKVPSIANLQTHKDSTCSNEHSSSACGINGDLTATIRWKTADWIPAHKETTQEICSGEFECISGDTRCDGYMQQECVDYNWKDVGTEIGECGVECRSDRSCPDDGFINNKYCKNDNLVQDYKDYSCSDYECTSDTITKTKEECDYSCQNGECLDISEPKEPEVSSLNKFFNNLWDWIKNTFK